MGKPTPIDLRSRLVGAVADGLSRRAAAEPFGVSAASAVRWVHASNTTRTLEAKPQGGDTRSHRIEDLSPVILAAVEAQKDITLVSWPNCCAYSMGHCSVLPHFACCRCGVMQRAGRVPAGAGSRPGRTSCA